MPFHDWGWRFLKFDENWVNTTYSHQVVSSVSVKSLADPKIQEYVSKLHSMVPDHNFTKTEHQVIKHGSACPKEDVDIFSLPEAKKFSEMEQPGGGEGGD